MAWAPPPTIINRVERAAPGFWREFIERANWALGPTDAVLTSWWRDRLSNMEVGGAENSQHLLGTAFDVTGTQLTEMATRLQAAGFTVVTYRGRYIHAQAWPAGIAKQAGLL